MLQLKLLVTGDLFLLLILFYPLLTVCVFIHIGVPYPRAKLQGSFHLFYSFARSVLILTSLMDSLFCQMIEKQY